MIWKLQIYLSKNIKFIFNPKNISLEMQNQQFIFITKDFFSVLCLFQDPLFLFVLSYLDIPIFFQKPILVLATFFFFFLVFSIFFLFGVNLSPKRTLKWWWCFGVILVYWFILCFQLNYQNWQLTFSMNWKGKKNIYFFRLFKIGLIFQSNCETRWQRAKWRKGRFKIRLVNNAY